MNNIIITGRIAQDIELKTTPNGITVCTFPVAVKRPNVKDTTDFIQCVAWQHTAEFITKYFSKGKMIAINGCLTSRKYEDKDGKKRTIYEVLIDTAEFCGDNAPAKSEEKTPNTYESNMEEVSTDGDLPL